MDATDTQKSEAAETALGDIAVVPESAGIMTTPPPMPHSEPRAPASPPVGTATLSGTELLLARYGTRETRDRAQKTGDEHHLLIMSTILLPKLLHNAH